MIQIAFNKHYENFNLDIDIEIPDHGITVLFGPSGSGKSSLLNLLAGLDNGVGQVKSSSFCLKQTIYDDNDKQIKVNPWLRKIGYVFQDHRLFPNMNVQDNILFGHKRRQSQLNPDDVINKFKVRELLEHYPHQLSGGQKQRVAMVRALLSSPELLILDEPLASLDYQSRQELLPYIECIHKELTIPIIYVSHDIKEVLRLADYIVVMNHGRIIDKGNLADLCVSQPLLTQAEGASFILQGIVSQIFEKDKLVQISCGDEDILMTDQNLKLKQAVRILIHSRDVSLCLTPPEDSSILNCVPVVIEELQDISSTKIRVLCNMGEQTVVAMISHRSARLLQIEKGRSLFAQFKATAMIK